MNDIQNNLLNQFFNQQHDYWEQSFKEEAIVRISHDKFPCVVEWNQEMQAYISAKWWVFMHLN